MLAVGFANILVAGTTQPYDTKISLLDTLDSLTEADLRVLANFAREGRIRIDKLIPTSQEYRDENGLGETASDLIVSLCKLESRGLIGETTPVNLNINAPGEVTHWVNRWRRRAFQLIPFGRTLLDTIREPEPPSQALNLQKI